SLGGRQRHGSTYAARKDHHGPELFDFRWFAQRSDDVKNVLAGVKAVEHACGLANALHDNGDGSCNRVCRFDRERNSFALLAKAQDDELTRSLLSGNPRGLDDELLDV